MDLFEYFLFESLGIYNKSFTTEFTTSSRREMDLTLSSSFKPSDTKS